MKSRIIMNRKNHLTGAIHSILVLKNIYQRFVTASSGNHGLACAHAFSKTDTSGIVFLPSSGGYSRIIKLSVHLLFIINSITANQRRVFNQRYQPLAPSGQFKNMAKNKDFFLSIYSSSKLLITR